MKSNSLALIGALVILLLSSYGHPKLGDEKSTTIIVIDGKALLVDVDTKGTVIETYMEVPEYFTTDKEHSQKVSEAVANYKKLTKAQLDQIRFIAMVDEGWEMDEFMQSNLVDLAEHYAQTYANQISITVAKNIKTERQVAYNLSNIKSLLVRNGVAAQDIHVSYKIDLGEEPTRFIKVVSNLKPIQAQLIAAK